MKKPTLKKPSKRTLLILAVVLVVAAGAGAWWYYQQQENDNESTEDVVLSFPDGERMTIDGAMPREDKIQALAAEGDSYVYGDQPKKAVKAYELALELADGEGDVLLYVGAAQAYGANGQDEEAREMIERAKRANQSESNEAIREDNVKLIEYIEKKL